MRRFGCSQRNALRIVGMSFSSYRYESRRRDETALKMRIKEITVCVRRSHLEPVAVLGDDGVHQGNRWTPCNEPGRVNDGATMLN